MSDPSGFQQSLTFAFHSCLTLSLLPLPFTLAFAFVLCPSAAAIWLPPSGFHSLTFPPLQLLPFGSFPSGFYPLAGAPLKACSTSLGHSSSFCSFCHVCLAGDF